MRIYRELSRNTTDLKARIRNVIASITEGTLQKVFENSKNRPFFETRQNDGHFENV